MAQLHINIASFNAGELSPLLSNRFAVEKVQAGCRRLRNFMPMVHGPAFRRPGMEFMGRAASDYNAEGVLEKWDGRGPTGASSSLRGFNFSSTTRAILEFSPKGLSVWMSGQKVAMPLVPLPYNEQECRELQMAQVNDVCYLTHANHPPMQLTRRADDHWTLEEIAWKWPPMGDENAEPDIFVTPLTHEILEVLTEEWPEFELPGGVTYHLKVTGGFDTSSKTKTLQVQHWSETDLEWKERVTLSWTGAGAFPDHLPQIPGSTGARGWWRILPIGEFTAGGTATLSYKDPHTHLTVAQTLDLSAPVGEGGNLKQASLKAMQVMPGPWQTTVRCPDKIPAGATLILQKQNVDTGAWFPFRTIELVPGKTLIHEETRATELRYYRFLWTGRAMTGGTASIQTLQYPPATASTITPSDTTGVIKLTSVLPLFHEEHIGSYWQIAHRRDAADATEESDPGRKQNADVELRIIPIFPAPDPDDDPDAEPGPKFTFLARDGVPVRVQGHWDVSTYGTWDATLYLEKQIKGVWTVLRSWTSRKDRNVIASGDEENEVLLRLRITAGSGEMGDTVSAPRFVMEMTDPRVTGVVKITAMSGAADANGLHTQAMAQVLTSLFDNTPTTLWTEGAFSKRRGFPTACGLHGQRLWFGGTKSQPMALWGSVVADYDNFRRSSLDDASVNFVPAAQQSNLIQWMVSVNNTLVLGTNGDEWTVSGGTPEGPITPVSVNIQRRSNYGSATVPAQLFGDSLVFVQRGGQRLREVSAQQEGAWSAADATVLADHIAEAGIVQFAIMHFPQSILWGVTADGQLLGFTMEKEQNVFAWHAHPTDGKVESVAVAYGVEADEVWIVVRRRHALCVERLDMSVLARQFSKWPDLAYLDSAKRFNTPQPTATLSGLDHLEGQTVTVLGDGAEVSATLVAGGQTTLSQPVRKAIAGLPFLSELQPMKIDLPIQDGSAQFRPWRTSRVGVKIQSSLGGEVADGPDRRFEKLNYRTVESLMDTGLALQSGDFEAVIESSARDGADVIVRTDGPYPLNVLGIMMKTDVYGGP